VNSQDENLSFDDFDIEADKNLLDENEQTTWNLFKKHKQFLKDESYILEFLMIIFMFIEEEKKKGKKVLMAQIMN
jgi:mannose/fructose/N-acetylgalactosamine-specific phosphotransferase system component IID